jgi:hypothetical protein
MTSESAGIDAVHERLERWFPDSRVESQEIFDRETHLFRIHLPTGRASELEVSREVLDHEPPEAIVNELSQSDSAERLRRDPSVRVQYFSSGIDHFETRYVLCDGRQYRVVRDDKHNVSIFDSSDNLLLNTPRQMLVRPTSIFRSREADWRDQIRAWRGEGQ